MNDSIREKIEPFREGLEDALNRAGNTHSLEDVVRQVQNGHAQFWVNGRSCIVTEVVRYPRKTVLRYWLATGDLDEILAMVDPLAEWGADHGCDLATMYGRPGWRKINDWRDQGWHPVITVMHKELV